MDRRRQLCPASVPVAFVSPSWATRIWILSAVLMAPIMKLVDRRATSFDGRTATVIDPG